MLLSLIIIMLILKSYLIYWKKLKAIQTHLLKILNKIKRHKSSKKRFLMTKIKKLKVK